MRHIRTGRARSACRPTWRLAAWKRAKPRSADTWSPWARWWIPTLEVIDELGGGDEESRRELAVMTAALVDPTFWLQREVLHVCWGRRAL